MRPRTVEQPGDPEAARAEIQRLYMASRRAVLAARRVTGGPYGERWERWDEARTLLCALAESETPDLAAARAAWRRGHHITDEQASVDRARSRP